MAQVPNPQGVVPSLESELDALASENAFSGVVRVDRADEMILAKAFGLAHRGYEIPNEVDTRFGIASGVKGLTALTVVSLVEEGVLELSTPARSLLGADLPLIGDDVTVEHLLAHRSGIGDYLDEDADRDIDDYMMSVPVHELATTEQYLAALDGHPTKFAPDERFSYCNGGFVVLALVAERASGVPFHDLVSQRVCGPAGMSDTEFLRSDELPGRTALGYLGAGHAARTNVLPLAGARQRRRRDLLDRGGLPVVLGGALCGPDRVARVGRARWSDPEAQCRPGTSATASGSGSVGRPTLCSSRASTPGSRSARCTTRGRT